VQLDQSRPAEQPAGGGVRFAVTGSDGRRSADWRVSTSRNHDDVYLAARLAARWIKVSLHESGSWQHGFINADLAQQYGPPESSRHFAIWDRPAELVPGWTRAAQVVVPASELQTRAKSGTQSRPVTQIPISDPPAAAVIEIWLEAPDSPGLSIQARPIGQLRQAGGGNVWVTARELLLPWDRRREFADYVAAARAATEAELQARGEHAGAEALSICLHDPQVPGGELILFEMAVPLTNLPL